jgi:hypothetical protein
VEFTFTIKEQHENRFAGESSAAGRTETYAESKLYDAMLAFAKRWPEVLSNSLEPGLAPTKMGGAGAPNDMEQAHRTQAWLAASDDAAALVTGEYFYHLRKRAPNPETHDEALQNAAGAMPGSVGHYALQGLIKAQKSPATQYELRELPSEGKRRDSNHAVRRPRFHNPQRAQCPAPERE